MWAQASQMGKTPFGMVYSTEAVVPAEIQGQMMRILHFDENRNEALLKVDAVFRDEI